MSTNLGILVTQAQTPRFMNQINRCFKRRWKQRRMLERKRRGYYRSVTAEKLQRTTKIDVDFFANTRNTRKLILNVAKILKNQKKVSA